VGADATPESSTTAAIPATTAQAQAAPRFSQRTKLFANDGNNSDKFGTSVVLSGDGQTALITAKGDTTKNGRTAGSAYVFTQTDNNWNQQQKLTAEDGDRNDQFGRSAALAADGTTAIVGANDITNDGGPGSAYVFTRADGEWSQQQKLTANNGDDGDRFGSSVALSSDGTTAVVGADADNDPNGSNGGSVYVFARSNGEWNQQQKLATNDGVGTDRFGTSVALSGNGGAVFAGALFGRGPNGDVTGSVDVFTRADGEWSQQQELTPDDGSSGGQFGGSVTVSSDGTTVLVGAEFNENPNNAAEGSAYVFTRADGEWSQQQKLIPSDGGDVVRFGQSVTVSSDGTTGLVSANTDADSAPNIGSTYVFTRADGEWSQQQELSPDDSDKGERFGDSVALSSDGATSFIGARFDANPNGGTATGSAYVFTSDDAAPGGGAGPSVRATVQQPGTPGGQARVQYIVSNVSGQSTVGLAVTTPSELSVNASASETTGTFGSNAQRVLFSQPDGEITATIAFEIPASASADATFDIEAAALNENDTATDTVTTTVDLGEPAAPATPRERALQIADVDDPAAISQRDITVAITRRNRGQAANGVDVTQRDITTLITLRNRAN
jgi:hypothetical protein